MKPHKHIRPNGGHYVDDATLERVKEMLREGKSLIEAAQHTRYFAADLDYALWVNIGGPGHRGPMF